MRKIRMGMIGGGRGAFIGGVHRIAAALDGEIELVCGAFSSDAERSRLSGEDLRIDPNRVYPDFETMIRAESALPADVRMDLVSIVTPNHVHFAPAKMALEWGFHVICDKPVTFSTDEAAQLAAIVRETGRVFALTHTYTGYPMVKQARQMLQNGELGAIRKVVVEYPQGWLSTPLEQSDQKQAAWRTDPTRSGKAGSVGDIGTHAENLAEYITGLHIESLCADVSTYVEGRLLDDDANVLLRMQNGVKGILHCSQICAGEENDLNIRIWCERGSLAWRQMEPNTLVVKWLDAPVQVLRTGGAGVGTAAAAATRIPAGHPEGYLEAFANIYKATAQKIQHILGGGHLDDPQPLDFPTIEEGVRGMKFIDAVIESGKRGAVWINV